MLVLGILGSDHKGVLDDSIASKVTSLLITVLREGSESKITEKKKLARGYNIWSKYIEDKAGLIKLLFTLSVESKRVTSIGSIVITPIDSSSSQAIRNSLLMVGSAEPKIFVSAIGNEIIRQDTGKLEHSSALMIVNSLVKKYPLSMLEQLPRLVEAVVRSLDPNVPSLREGCINAATTALHVLVKNYPIVSFHQETQHLAVANNGKGSECGIILYELRTASRSHMLEGHKGNIRAVAFSQDGKYIASYAEDLKVKIWQSNPSFLVIFTSNPCLHTIDVPHIEVPGSLLDVHIEWTSPHSVQVRAKDVFTVKW